MRTIEISKKGFVSTLFIVDNQGNIYAKNSTMGFWKRDDLTLDDLENHIKNMKSEKFTVKESTAFEPETTVTMNDILDDLIKKFGPDGFELFNQYCEKYNVTATDTAPAALVNSLK